MRAWRARNQLETELAQVEAALADQDADDLMPVGAEWNDGWWWGRRHGLREALYLIREVENHVE